MADKKSFVLYKTSAPVFKALSDEDAGKLIKAIFDYTDTGTLPTFTGEPFIAWASIQSYLDNDAEKYAERCKKNAENIRKRWGETKGIEEEQKDTNVYKCNDSNTKDTDIDIDIDTDIDIDIDIENKDIDMSDESSAVRINYQEIANLYNQHCKSLPKVAKLNDKRKREIKKLLKDFEKEDIVKAFEMAESNAFLRGEVTDWQANFDWLIKSTNLLKVIEGNYASHGNQKAADKNSADKDYHTDFGLNV